MIRFFLTKNMCARAKAVIAEADLLFENHGNSAHDAARDLERNANSLGETFYWRAVRKVVATRIDNRVDLCPPSKAANCTTCLVQRIAAHDGEGPPLPLACVSCVGQNMGRRLGRQQGLSAKFDNGDAQEGRATASAGLSLLPGSLSG